MNESSPYRLSIYACVLCVCTGREISQSAKWSDTPSAENGDNDKAAFLEPGGSGISFSLLNEVSLC